MSEVINYLTNIPYNWSIVTIPQVQITQLEEIHSTASSPRLKIRYSLEYFVINEQTLVYQYLL